jgi:hypothetical protein
VSWLLTLLFIFRRLFFLLPGSAQAFPSTARYLHSQFARCRRPPAFAETFPAREITMYRPMISALTVRFQDKLAELLWQELRQRHNSADDILSITGMITETNACPLHRLMAVTSEK